MSQAPHPQPPVRRPRRGMTLVEVMVALTLLATVLLALGAFSVRLARLTTNGRALGTAEQLAADRLEAVKGAPKYGQIESLFQATESTVPGYPGFKRQTVVTHVGGTASDTIDYRVVTVIVTARRLTTPVRKTTIIAPY